MPRNMPARTSVDRDPGLLRSGWGDEGGTSTPMLVRCESMGAIWWDGL